MAITVCWLVIGCAKDGTRATEMMDKSVMGSDAGPVSKASDQKQTMPPTAAAPIVGTNAGAPGICAGRAGGAAGSGTTSQPTAGTAGRAANMPARVHDDDADAGDATPHDAGTTATKPRLPPLEDQTPPQMMNGIVMDEEGYLWVTSMTDSQLIRLEAPGDKIVARYGREVGVDGPDDLVIDRDYVYYTAAATLFGAVAKLDRRTGQATTIAAIGLGINPIAWGPNGKLLTGLSPAATLDLGVALGWDDLYEVDPVANTFKKVVEDDKGINAFCYAPDGYVYGPHGLAGTAVLRVDMKTGTVTSIHEANLASSVRYNPRDNHLYVLAGESETRATLLRMALDGSDYSVFARMSDQPQATFTSADNFAIAPDGTFYVTRFMSPIITRISADGTKIDDIKVGRQP